MSTAKNVKFNLKVVINKEKTKVLYAEANSDFTDILLSFLTMPLGQIVRVLKKHYGNEAPVIGSLNTLYNGLSNLDSAYFWTESGKQMLLNPRSSFSDQCCNLKLDISDNQPTTYFICGDGDCNFKGYRNVSMYYDTLKCDCGKSLSQEISVRGSITQGADYGDGGVFTMSTTHFIISDDLQILPSATGYAIRFLSNLGITDTDETEIMNVTFGLNEIMDLLKGLLLSRTPLTDLILNKKQVNFVTAKNETGTLVHQMEKRASPNTAKMTVKAIFQESTKKLLFAEAANDFIEFLYSLLTIPLGAVECLLGGNASLKNIDNLYRSITDINGDKYLKTKDTKTMLLKPKLPYGYISKNQILPLNEERAPVLFLYHDSPSEENYFYPSWFLVTRDGTSVSFKSPKGPGNYVKGPTMFMVTDDLTVTPLCTTSSFSILSRLKIPLSDVKELELNIGLEEALSILKASLTSTCALTDGLINPILKKQPKQEQ